VDSLKSNAHWLLRLALAGVFIYHGIGKVAGPGGIGGFAEMMNLPYVAALLVTLAEIGAGLGILVGGFGLPLITRLSGLVIVPVMLGAIAMVHWPRWSFTPSESHPMGGMEFQVVLMLIGLYFALTAGKQSAH